MVIVVEKYVKNRVKILGRRGLWNVYEITKYYRIINCTPFFGVTVKKLIYNLIIFHNFIDTYNPLVPKILWISSSFVFYSKSCILRRIDFI